MCNVLSRRSYSITLYLIRKPLLLWLPPNIVQSTNKYIEIYNDRSD